MDQTIEDVRNNLENEFPTLTKKVNGESIVLTEDERKRVLDEWAVNIFSEQNSIETKINNGFFVESEGFTLGLLEGDRLMLSQMLALVKEALDLGLITNETSQTISDKFGQKHEITTLRFRQIMVQYGMYYKGLWDQLTN
jgi:hypothetical protein